MTKRGRVIISNQKNYLLPTIYYLLTSCYTAGMKKKPLLFQAISIFPEVFDAYLSASILGRARKSGLIDFEAINLRKWTHDVHQTVDDKPFGGGAGMLMKPEPFHEALVELGIRRKKDGGATAKAKKTKVIVTAANGKLFTHVDAVRLAKEDRIVFLCGRYEGIDQRVIDVLADEVFSIGSFVLTGGELPAMVMTDAIARQIPGVLGDSASLDEESWADGSGEYPQYTRPEVWLGHEVPKVLLSGNHAKIKEWRDRKRKW